MKKETIEALQKAGQLLAEQEFGQPKGEPIEMTINCSTEPNVCATTCTVCEGQTHHWTENFLRNDEDDEIIHPDEAFWGCKHCDHRVSYGESDKHPSGCDCPDCLPFDDSDCWLCSCGNFIEDGCHCSICNRQPPWGCPCSFCQDGDDDDWTDGTDDYGFYDF